MNKIKKSIAVFAALLLMSNGLNASISIAETCWEWADREATAQGHMQGWNHQQEHIAFLALLDECENQNP
jgi:hypothetical protein